MYAARYRVPSDADPLTDIERNDLPKVKGFGWVTACAPDSPARRRPLNLDFPPPRPIKKTFIHDHTLVMDPCLHPNHFHHHGQFLSHNQGPAPQHAMIPEFSQCSTVIHHNIRIPTPYQWVEDIYPRQNDPEFDTKDDERLLWRGSNTGIHHSAKTRWQGNHRDFLVGFANELHGNMSVLMSTVSNVERVGEPREVRKARINPAILDIAFAGVPISCDPATCDHLEEIQQWRDRQNLKQAGNYKYVLDVSTPLSPFFFAILHRR